MERYPDIFGRSEFLKKYPYFLPCSVPAAFAIIACFITFFWLREVSGFYTHASMVLISDPYAYLDCTKPYVASRAPGSVA